jgi:threonine/homoserine/homoserine lactone efflux protein
LSGTNFTLFLLAALVIAAIPGPGIFYVAARTLSGGKRAGIASTFGTALGGLVHVIAGGLGVSAIILASAELFTALKFAGALYLVWLGLKTFREARDLLPQQAMAAGTQRVFREGMLVVALNPKTAASTIATGLRAVHRRSRYFAGAGAAAELVGWVERSETHQILARRHDGFRGVYHRAGRRPDPLALPILRSESQLSVPACTHHPG